MAIRAIKTEAKCKLCKNPRRAEIDAEIERLTRRDISVPQILELLAAMDVPNPTYDNVKSHRKNHCEILDDKTAEEQEAANEEIEEKLKREALAIISRILGGDWREKGLTPSPEQIGELHRALYVYELELRIAAGLPIGITHDQVLKSIGETTKRKGEESQTELLKTMGRGIEQAAGAIANALGGPKAIEAPVIDGEFEVVE